MLREGSRYIGGRVDAVGRVNASANVRVVERIRAVGVGGVDVVGGYHLGDLRAGARLHVEVIAWDGLMQEGERALMWWEESML